MHVLPGDPRPAPLTELYRAKARCFIALNPGACVEERPDCGQTRRMTTQKEPSREAVANVTEENVETRAQLLPEEQDTTLVVACWEFAGVGYLTNGDAALALSAAARAREQRQAARDAA